MAGALDNTVVYTYNSAGERATATYTNETSHGNNYWGYADYISLGSPEGSSRAFQTMVRLDTNGNPTAEAFHYQYDTSGRITNATFAMTPETNYTPTGGATYYTVSHPAATRGRAHYTYDSGGRVTALNYWWDTFSSFVNGAPTYTSSGIVKYAAGYEVNTSLNRGLKNSVQTYTVPATPRQSPARRRRTRIMHNEIS